MAEFKITDNQIEPIEPIEPTEPTLDPKKLMRPPTRCVPLVAVIDGDELRLISLGKFLADSK